MQCSKRNEINNMQKEQCSKAAHEDSHAEGAILTPFDAHKSHRSIRITSHKASFLPSSSTQSLGNRNHIAVCTIGSKPRLCARKPLQCVQSGLQEASSVPSSFSVTSGSASSFRPTRTATMPRPEEHSAHACRAILPNFPRPQEKEPRLATRRFLVSL